MWCLPAVPARPPAAAVAAHSGSAGCKGAAGAYPAGVMLWVSAPHLRCTGNCFLSQQELQNAGSLRQGC